MKEKFKLLFNLIYLIVYCISVKYGADLFNTKNDVYYYSGIIIIICGTWLTLSKAVEIYKNKEKYFEFFKKKK